MTLILHAHSQLYYCTVNNVDHHSAKYHHQAFNSRSRHLCFPDKFIENCEIIIKVKIIWMKYGYSFIEWLWIIIRWKSYATPFDHRITCHHTIWFHHHAFNWTNRHLCYPSLTFMVVKHVNKAHVKDTKIWKLQH